ncbi:YtxH domain-containing protein [Pontibacter sp. JH31]|uniref:YtxH domain-containing protein n=1 Tax=Pontibacter aquaedesilientis TaxID=2766980 RepID=A0ABR7XES8_9BACT|nr:YtxH domain-containing protein [Pontibacter aquaedesilientis]MBD1396803.1 YtxH domain-containing protein [Pontibacter aquaedesilientis]
MRTKMDYSSLGETKSTYSNTPRSTYGQVGGETSGHMTHSSVREQQQSMQTGTSPRRFSGSSSSENSGALGVAMGLLAGASVGVLAGILMAPDSGRITRRRLSDSAAWVGRGITESFGNKRRGSSWINKTEETHNRATDNARNMMYGNNREV